VLTAIKGGDAQALLALSEPLTFSHLKEICEFAAEQHLPSMYGFREFCDAGGLVR
jgi:putative tryptophan/tyrosine transport system substrate-binding protein